MAVHRAAPPARPGTRLPGRVEADTDTTTVAMAAVTTTSRRRPTGPDRVTVMLLSLTVFLVILAVLAWQVRSAPARPGRRMVVVRRVYETRVVETVVGAPGGGSSVTQSVSSSGSASPLPAGPTTRTS
jgi:hypothetical protein